MVAEDLVGDGVSQADAHVGRALEIGEQNRLCPLGESGFCLRQASSLFMSNDTALPCPGALEVPQFRTQDKRVEGTASAWCPSSRSPSARRALQFMHHETVDDGSEAAKGMDGGNAPTTTLEQRRFVTDLGLGRQGQRPTGTNGA